MRAGGTMGSKPEARRPLWRDILLVVAVVLVCVAAIVAMNFLPSPPSREREPASVPTKEWGRRAQ